jgi:hypothetical protein
MEPQTDSSTPIAVKDMDSDYACFVKAKDKHEPTFTLRAQDFSAPATIDAWIEFNEHTMGVDHPKIVGARAIAAQMRAWPNRRQAD